MASGSPTSTRERVLVRWAYPNRYPMMSEAKIRAAGLRASGDQLHELTSLIDSGIIRPVVDRVFPFESTKEAMAYVEHGRAKGKVIVKVR